MGLQNSEKHAVQRSLVVPPWTLGSSVNVFLSQSSVLFTEEYGLRLVPSLTPVVFDLSLLRLLVPRILIGSVHCCAASSIDISLGGTGSIDRQSEVLSA